MISKIQVCMIFAWIAFGPKLYADPVERTPHQSDPPPIIEGLFLSKTKYSPDLRAVVSLYESIDGQRTALLITGNISTIRISDEFADGLSVRQLRFGSKFLLLELLEGFKPGDRLLDALVK